MSKKLPREQGKRPNGRAGDDLRNAIEPREQKFCQLMARGLSQSQAYIRIGGTAQEPSAAGGRLLAKPKVKRYLDFLRACSAASAALTRNDMVAVLREIIEDPNAPRKDRTAAIAQASKMLGYDAPAKVDVRSASLDAFLAVVTGGAIGAGGRAEALGSGATETLPEPVEVDALPIPPESPQEATGDVLEGAEDTGEPAPAKAHEGAFQRLVRGGEPRART